MAFNWKTFQTRAITAIIFAAVMLVGLLWNKWSFLILFSIIHFGCWWEYLKLLERINKTVISRFCKFLIMDAGYILLWLIGFKDHETPGLKIASTGITISDALILLMLAALVIFMIACKKNGLKTIGMSLGGLLYISLSCGLMINMFGTTDFHIHDTMYVIAGSFIPLSIVISIWINDTMAYIVGSLIGKMSLSKISPKKTWEGTIGGIILATIIMYFIFVLFYFKKSGANSGLELLRMIIAMIALIASVSGVFGDLFESRLKRMAGVKDSGSIMPGHGGFLDRFDSLLFAIPFVWLFLHLSKIIHFPFILS